MPTSRRAGREWKERESSVPSLVDLHDEKGLTIVAQQLPQETWRGLPRVCWDRRVPPSGLWLCGTPAAANVSLLCGHDSVSPHTAQGTCPRLCLPAKDHLRTPGGGLPEPLRPTESPVLQRSGLAVTDEWRPGRRRAIRLERLGEPGQPLTTQNERRLELRGASPVLRVVMDQGRERAVVNFVMDAVAGARRTLSLSVALNVLGLRFIRDGLCCTSRRCGVFSCALSRQPYFSSMSLRRLRPAELRIPVMPSCCAAAAINFSSSDCEDIAAPHVPSVAAAASHASARQLVLHFVTGLMVGNHPVSVPPTGAIPCYVGSGRFGAFRRVPSCLFWDFGSLFQRRCGVLVASCCGSGTPFFPGCTPPLLHIDSTVEALGFFLFPVSVRLWLPSITQRRHHAHN